MIRCLQPLAVLVFLTACTTTELAQVTPLDYAGRTIVFYDTSHGTQVEYFAPDGRAFLWYPGNTRVVAGEWKKRISTNSICFRYGRGTYNPVTRRTGGGFDCTSFRAQRRLAQSACAGDPFRLASGKLPYRLADGRRGLNGVTPKCGGPLD